MNSLLVYSIGMTALEEAVAHLDSDISKVLVKIGGADSSVLRLSSPSPTRRKPNIETFLPAATPRSPRLRKKDQGRPDSLSPPAAPSNLYRQSSCPVGDGSGNMLTVDSPSSRGSSRASSLNDVREDENEDEEEREYIELHSNLKQQRRNSLSLPDLRDMTGCLINSPTHSLNSSSENFHSHSHNKRTMNNSTLPELIEEADSEEEIIPLSRVKSIKSTLQRKDSCSLPDLKSLAGGSLDEEDDLVGNCWENGEDYSEEDTLSFSANSAHNTQPSLLKHRQQQHNSFTLYKDMHHAHQRGKNEQKSGGLRTRKKPVISLDFKT